jgi:hypothetical protein
MIEGPRSPEEPYEMAIPFLPTDKAGDYSKFAEFIRVQLEEEIRRKNGGDTLQPSVRYDQVTGEFVLSVEARWAPHARGILQTAFHALPILLNENVGAGIRIAKDYKGKALLKVTEFKRSQVPAEDIERKVLEVIHANPALPRWIDWSEFMAMREKLVACVREVLQHEADKKKIDQILHQARMMFLEWQKALSSRLDELRKK